MLGAAHAFEIPFVFGHFDLGKEGNIIFTDANEAGRKALSATMMSHWAQFAYAGDPGKGRNGDQPQWAAWDDSSGTSGKLMVFDTPAGGGSRMSSEGVTKASVIAEIDRDPRLPAQRDKCERFRDLVVRSMHFTEKDYPAERCAQYPLAAYPWRE